MASLAVKAIIATAAVGTISAVTYISVTSGEKWVSLGSLDKLPTTYTGKFGERFKTFLLSVENKDHNSNLLTDRADLIIKGDNGQKPTLVSGSYFESLKTLSPDKKTISLQKIREACKNAYTADLPTDETGVKKFNEVFEYCSALGKKVITLGTSLDATIKTNLKVDEPKGKWNDKLGSESKDLLVSTEKSNDWYWEIRDNDFLTDNLTAAQGENYFVKSKHKKLKDLCEDGYAQTKSNNTSSATAPSKSEILKFCSLGKA